MRVTFQCENTPLASIHFRSVLITHIFRICFFPIAWRFHHHLPPTIVIVHYAHQSLPKSSFNHFQKPKLGSYTAHVKSSSIQLIRDNAFIVCAVWRKKNSIIKSSVFRRFLPVVARSAAALDLGNTTKNHSGVFYCTFLIRSATGAFWIFSCWNKIFSKNL